MPIRSENPQDSQTLYRERKARVDAAVALTEPDRVPVTPLAGSVAFHLYNATYRDAMYNYTAAQEAVLKYHLEFEPDVGCIAGGKCGKANEIGGSTMIDWPGRPGTSVPDTSSHQVIEQEYLLEDEYPEFLKDYTGFMLRKYIPRAYPNLAGLSGITFAPMVVLGTDFLSTLYNPGVLDAYQKLMEIGREEAEMARVGAEYAGKLEEAGFPPYFLAVGEAPFDVLGDYFRGTIGVLMDMEYRPDEVLAACELFADNMIAAFSWLEDAGSEVKRVSFPLHKGVDTFMSNEKYEKFYWKPFRKVLMALIDMGVTPFIYTEGSYNTRLEILKDIPRGKVIYHFEDVDMAEAKRVLGDTACISGNVSHYLLEHGSAEEVVDQVKKLIDTCAPGGGYMVDTNMVLDKAKRENLEAMFDTCKTYGKR